MAIRARTGQEERAEGTAETSTAGTETAGGKKGETQVSTPNWTTQILTQDIANTIQVNSGILVKEFDVAAPKKPAADKIICDTTGDFSISLVPETTDFFEDINNADVGTKEGLRITGWKGTLSIQAVTVSADTIKLALGAAQDVANSGISGKNIYDVAKDFQKLYWLGDMTDPAKIFVIELDNTISTGGFSFSSKNKGKGTISLELQTCKTVQDITKVPMTFYILTKNNEG